MRNEKIAICPGSFDPITHGHLDIVRRGLCVFDRVIIAVGHNPLKQDCSPRRETRHDQRSFRQSPDRGGFLRGPARGLSQKEGRMRHPEGPAVISDFELEMQLALMNRRLCDEAETFFLMTDYNPLFVSSTIVKATVAAGGSVEGLVPPPALEKLLEKFPHMNSTHHA
jgi:pantetheine-phosphate adenylyltransferase